MHGGRCCLGGLFTLAHGAERHTTPIMASRMQEGLLTGLIRSLLVACPGTYTTEFNRRVIFDDSPHLLAFVRSHASPDRAGE